MKREYVCTNSKVHMYILRRPQNFAKSSPNCWLTLNRTKVMRRFCKILWLSQNIWTLILLKKIYIQNCFFQFLWFFRLKCWFKGQIISRIHLSLPNAYKLMCFDKNINGNRRDVKFFEWNYWSLHWRKNLTLSTYTFN